ncbi:MAG: serine/threonine-protein kinase [Acidobacteriota bacterium]
MHGTGFSQSIDSEALLNPVVGALLSLMIHKALARLRREMAAGLRFGSYRLEHKLGEGGMGEVWLARHPLLARPAAIKVMHRERLESDRSRREEMLERFLREARTTASLESPHTVRVLDYGVLEDGEAFLVMENLEGIDLGSLVRESGPQPIDRVRSILLQACESLEEAHDKGLVHRDLKPANLMLCRANRRLDQLKVLDFGIVQVDSDQGEPLTRTGALVGTAGYLAPELLAGEQAAATPSSDIYALACVAFYLLTGRAVFTAGPALAQLSAHLRDDPLPPSSFAESLPAAWDELVLSCLAKSPGDRPASIPELARSLEAIAPSGDWSQEDQAAWWRDFPERSSEWVGRADEGTPTEEAGGS